MAGGERPGQKELFGHPRGLTVLAGTEMWERFSFYGMRALLMLYMIKYLLLPEHARHVFGLAAFRHALAATFGPMDDLAFAAQTFGLYSGFIYLTPLAGAWLGDRVLGRTRTVTIGCLLMSAGHLTMAVEHLFLLALTLLILGGGCVIGNMAAQVGQLYGPDDDRRTRAFGVYLITLNIGALVAPLVVGTLGEKVAWHWGFSAAGVGMLIGLATYLSGRRHLPPDRVGKRGASEPLTRPEWRRVFAILALMFPFTLFGSAAQQAYAVMYVWADKAVDRNLFGWDMPVTWIGVFDGVMTIAAVIAANRVWMWLDKHKGEPGDLTKLTLGYATAGAAYLLIAAAATLPVTPLIAWLAFYVVLDASFALVDPPLQSLVSRDSPASVNATMMALLKASSAMCYFLLGWMGRFYEPLGPARFWMLTGALPLAACAILVVFRARWLRALSLHPRRGAPATA